MLASMLSVQSLMFFSSLFFIYLVPILLSRDLNMLLKSIYDAEHHDPPPTCLAFSIASLS